MTKIINLLGGPGSGKSSIAMELTPKLKKRVKAELVTEYAKDKTWKKDLSTLKDQCLVFGKQNHRQLMLINQVDYVVTDSPIILSLVYIPDNYPRSFIPFVLDTWHSYNNLNFFVRRVKPYQAYGRNQSKDEAIAIDNKIYKLITDYKIPFTIIDGSDDGWKQALEIIEKDIECMNFGKLS